MLELRNIVKDYVSGNNVTHALKGVSVNFRKNEFVSILGPSGCGKTTLLNIIGGLDRYTDGDLFINAISTKDYKDRDWDTYRNHSIGFVFQTYNLISHQNILKNVELALTISGVSKEERRKRAYEALKLVGLEGMEKKKPNQLSGGQCQRVAIARALINNPEILLADEPTGALDSETSVQIMELLKEVATDRLVIMVTHNPDLAYQYSTRIVKMSDGLLLDDSDPYKPTKSEKKALINVKVEEEKEEVIITTSLKRRSDKPYFISCAIAVVLAVAYTIFNIFHYFKYWMFVYVGIALAFIVAFVCIKIVQSKSGIQKVVRKKRDTSKGKKKKTSMSLWTAIGLSTSNLFSKMKRTVLVTIAGSIGIIGVSAVLAVSRGVKEYIADLQNDMLSSYPITIAEEAVDYTSLMTGLNSKEDRKHVEFDPNNPKVGVDSMIAYLMDAYSDFTNVKTNTIDDKMLAFVEGMPQEDVGVIKYNYKIDPTNNIFGKWKDTTTSTEDFISFNGLTQRYIAELKSLSGFSAYASYVDFFTDFMHELPDNDDYLLEQYDVIAAQNENVFSTNVDDLVLVVDQETTLTDILLAQLGVFEHDEFLNIAKCAMAEQELKKDPAYQKKSQKEKEEAMEEVRKLYEYTRAFEYEDLLGRDFYYFPQNTLYKEDKHVADDKISIDLNFSLLDSSSNLDTIVTVSYQSYAGFNLLFGTCFMKEGSTYVSKTIACVNLAKSLNPSLVVKDQKDLDGTWLAFEPADLLSADVKDISGLLSKALFTFTYVPMTEKITFSKDGTSRVATPIWTVTPDPVQGYSYNAVADNSWISNPSASGVNGMKMNISAILRLKDSKKFGSLKRGLYYSKEFNDKFMDDSKDALVTTKLKDHMSNKLVNGTEFNQAYVKFKYYDAGKLKVVDGYAQSLNGGSSVDLTSLISAFVGVDQMETNILHLRSLCGYKAIVKSNGDGEFEGISFEKLPKEIAIYPRSFSGKESITKYLDRWNSEEVLTLNGKKYTKLERDDLTYTDTISLIAAVIDTFIDAITIALIVFTSLSLVVSCFMIAVITYISVVERIKEIGVIRSLGGRKGDVASLFVMETLLTGLFSGIFGIVMTYILQIVVNIVLVAEYSIAIMHLTVGTALLMIGVSIALSVLSGLIPSQSAAHKDPVVALRSNE